MSRDSFCLQITRVRLGLFAASTSLMMTQSPTLAGQAIPKVFFDDVLLKKEMAKGTGVNPASITSKDVEDFRMGFCNAYRDYSTYPTEQIKAYCQRGIKKTSTDAHSTLGSSSATGFINSSDAHSECLNARDYEGCIRVKTDSSRASPVSDCKADTWCKATAGTDMLGLPKIEGWYTKNMPSLNSVGYKRPDMLKVMVKGNTNRYISEESIVRYYQSPEAGKAPTTTTIGSSQTRCYGYGSLIKCSTTPATTITTPGRAARPGGVMQMMIVDVIDCREKTIGHHIDQKLSGKWKSIIGTRYEELAADYCPIIDSLELSSFRKYAND